MKVLILLTVFLLCSSGPAASQEVLQPASVLTNGTSIIFHSQGDRNLFGNNVTLRAAYIPETAQRAWVDTDNPLLEGLLRNFYIYVHNMSNIDTASTRIRLQIWRPVDLDIPTMKLVYEQLVQVQSHPSTSALYTYILNGTFQVLTNDFIGWTNEGQMSPISFQYLESHRTYHYKFPSNQLPQVAHTYTFDSSYLPSVFSIAALIEPAFAGLTVSTAPIGSRSSAILTAPTGSQTSTSSPGSISSTAHVHPVDPTTSSGATIGTAPSIQGAAMAILVIQGLNLFL
jgi:hypothetical protein